MSCELGIVELVFFLIVQKIKNIGFGIGAVLLVFSQGFFAGASENFSVKPENING